MKKLIAIVLALALVLSLAACGGSKPAETKVSVFWYDEADVYLSTVRSELNKALEAAGIAYDNQYAGKDQAKQMELSRPLSLAVPTCWSSTLLLPVTPTSLRTSLTLLATSPLSSSTVLSATKAPM